MHLEIVIFKKEMDNMVNLGVFSYDDVIEWSEVLEADSFVLHSLHTLTGLKFFISAEPDARHLDQVTHTRDDSV